VQALSPRDKAHAMNRKGSSVALTTAIPGANGSLPYGRHKRSRSQRLEMPSAIGNNPAIGNKANTLEF
jgi:hypothetical protein